eukprot:TRINITY_DN68152_c11_g2_i1.p1 TRINITY_DN68152_c11_g2~~TRINITY_DN68152_c11_g2_i1.p1  ORF type:complete len:259 (-),score=155.68 TRINITY_DN68152_c11_g2_i1:65-769(-)
MKNYMKALGAAAIANPSAADRKAREQIAQRKLKHEMDNDARALTKEQRAAKLRLKLQEDTSVEVVTSVFSVPELTGQVRFKLNMSAEHFNFTGCAIRSAEGCMVVVEGGPKGMRRFTRLLLHRIKWDEQLRMHERKMRGEEVDGDDGKAGGEDHDEDDDDEEEEDDDAGSSSSSKSSASSDTPTVNAKLQWTGVLARRRFKTFQIVDLPLDAQVTKFLRSRDAAHYWNYVKVSF